MRKSEGLRLLRKHFGARPQLVKAAEARELGFACRQSLDHILRGMRSPTLDQALALSGRYGIGVDTWRRAPRGGKV